jgi:CrcB protein
MKKAFWIFGFGMVGAVGRYLLQQVPINGVLPLSTLLVNSLGCYFLGYWMTHHWQHDVKIGLMVGFCGSLTTFGTLCRQVTELPPYQSVIYIFLNLLLGAGAVCFGMHRGKKEGV